MLLSNLSDCTVLIVDDSPENITWMSEALSSFYQIKVTTSGKEALKLLKNNQIELVLLDIIMPGLTGYDVIKEIRRDPKTHDIPVIFLTAKDTKEDEKIGLKLGASDYIHKPINVSILKSRVKTHLQNKRSRDILSNQNDYLEKEIKNRYEELNQMQDAIVYSLAGLAETRDPETGDHILRTQYYVRALAEELSQKSKYHEKLCDNVIDAYFKAAPLHDIGKVGITDNILLKPGKLTFEEFEEMKKHPMLGLQTLLKAEKRLGKPNMLLNAAKEIAYGHHEKWDGSGYPEGLSGENIPLSARLMALADVYDALISRRVYKDPMSHDAAKSIIVKGRANHFDPEVVDAFLAIEDKFIDIAETYSG
ncbi:response regulator [Thaumasiovibrio subtropicus]|uniref:response regulator n=1 Tax=Thaumasiovibrio subtropicus TaxID=1891207 RepID=UPI000B3562DA|nr:two-component system response regulator [Thaumasiovibrio subtropicus]